VRRSAETNRSECGRDACPENPAEASRRALDGPEELLQRKHKRPSGSVRRPHEPVALDQREVIARCPHFNGVLVTVKDPVERYPGLAIAKPLEEAVRPGGGRGSALRRQAAGCGRGSRSGCGLRPSRPRRGRLHQDVRAPGDVGGGREDNADRLLRDVVAQRHREPLEEHLMRTDVAPGSPAARRTRPRSGCRRPASLGPCRR
jgi:hypothetical protein